MVFEALTQRNRQFEVGLEDLLSQDQQKRYAEWKENQRNLARKRAHHGRHERTGQQS